jgi:hypothetical protein
VDFRVGLTFLSAAILLFPGRGAAGSGGAGAGGGGMARGERDARAGRYL